LLNSSEPKEILKLFYDDDSLHDLTVSEDLCQQMYRNSHEIIEELEAEDREQTGVLSS
jgi:hypothetical protein